MSQARDQRDVRRQLGKFYTPEPLEERIVATLNLRDGMRVLEPSCGDGSFVVAIQNRANASGFTVWIDAVDIEPSAVDVCQTRAGSHTAVAKADFFEWSPNGPLTPLTRTLYWSRVRPEYLL